MKRVKILKLTDTTIEALVDDKIFNLVKDKKEEGRFNFYNVTIDSSKFKAVLLNWFGMYKIEKYIVPDMIHLDFFDVTPTNYPFTENKLMMIRALYSTIGVDMPPVMTKEWFLLRMMFDGPNEWLNRVNEELGIRKKEDDACLE